MDDITSHLAAHDFARLFVEELGWDRGNGTIGAPADGRSFVFRRVAHKRGLQVLTCEVDGSTIVNRERLRRLQREIGRAAHEHILVYVDAAGRRQVWQWAIRQTDGRKLRHREHPFHSVAPPAPLLERLRLLRFGLDEEERVTLIDALQRARAALDVEADVSVFFRNPYFMERSAALLAALRTGTESAFQEFVVFHMRLAPWSARPFRRAGLDEEDLNQLAYMALLRAAHYFDHERGFQFSTYAVTTVRNTCLRELPEAIMSFAMPGWLFWAYRRVLRVADRVSAARGQSEADGFVADWLARHIRPPQRAAGLRRAFELSSLSDRSEPEFWSAQSLASESEAPTTEVFSEDTRSALHRALDELKPEDARLLKLRYGFDGPTHTLEEIGSLYGLTKERIRQRQLKAEAALRVTMLRLFGEPEEPAEEGGEESDQAAATLIASPPEASAQADSLFEAARSCAPEGSLAHAH